MNDFFQKKDIDFSALKSQFQCWQFSCFEVLPSLSEEVYIRAFCCKVKNLPSLQQEWKEINSFIAATYVPKSRSSFERWSTYLLFICTDENKIPKTTHYEIENNKFSMRKMVEHTPKSRVGDFEVIKLLNRRILLTNINYQEVESNVATSNPTFIPELSCLSQSLKKEKISSGASKDAKEARLKWIEAELTKSNHYEN